MLTDLTGYSIDRMEDNVQAGLTLRSSVVGVRVRSGVARFIHPGSPNDKADDHLGTEEHAAAKVLSQHRVRKLYRPKPWLGRYALMPLASFSPYRPNDDHWAASASANPYNALFPYVGSAAKSRWITIVHPLRRLEGSRAPKLGSYNHLFGEWLLCSCMAATSSPSHQTRALGV